MHEPPGPDPGSSIWPLTDWSGVRKAGELVGKDAESLNRLILKYQFPLKIHLVSTFPNLKEQADELLQDFAEDKILRDGWLAKADRQRGRFRNFLKHSLTNFLKDRLDKETKSPASLEELEIELPAEQATSELFDLQWTRTILADTLARMERDCKTEISGQPNRVLIWEIFRLRVLHPIFDDIDPAPYDTIASLGILSPADAHNKLATAKRMFRRHLEGVITEYEKNGAAARMELEDIKQFLRSISGA